MHRRSAVDLDSVESVDRSELVERMGRLSSERMREVCAALDVAIGGARCASLRSRYREPARCATVAP